MMGLKLQKSIEKPHFIWGQETYAIAECFIIALLLCFAQISGNIIFIGAVLFMFLLFTLLACSKDFAFYILLFFLPWSPLLRLNSGGVSFFTLALILTCLYYFQKNGFKLELYQIVLTSLITVTTLIAKGIFSNPIEKNYLFFLLMLLLFPCVTKQVFQTTKFDKLVLFFAFGIILAAISARQAAAYPNISQFIKVDSYLTITRLSGYYGDPNFYSAQITACIAGLQLLMSSENRRSKQFFYTIILIALIFCGLLSASKSFIIVLACLFLFWIPVFLEKGAINGKIALLVGILTTFVVFFSSSYVQKLISYFEVRFSYASSISKLTTGRTDIWLKYFKEFTKNIPLTVFGEGYTSVNLNGKASHNTVIQSLYQFGLIGLPILLTWVVLNIKNAYHEIYKNKHYKQIILICIGVTMPWLSLDILFFDEFFLLPIFAVMGISFVENKLSSDKEML